MPKIVASAIKFKPKGSNYFQIMCGKRHCEILEMMYKLGIEYEKVSSVQGFLTDEDQFIDRYDAAQMVFHSGQLSSSTELWQKMKSTENVCAHALYSEDLW